MSSWLDLIDDASLDRFVAAGGTSDASSQTAAFPMQAGASLPDSEAWDLSSISHIAPPEDDVASSVTIIPSVSSSASERHPPLDDQLVYRGRILLEDDLVSADRSEVFSSSLSLHPESVDSSVMSDFTEDLMLSSVSSGELSRMENDDLSITSVEHSAHSNGTKIPTDSTPTKVEGGNVAIVDPQSSEWYSNFQTEGDWNDFRAAASQLLQAIDCPVEERDLVMAQLIAQEEVAFWDQKKRASLSAELAAEADSNWLVNLFAGVGLVALTGAVLVRALKGR